MEWNWKLAVVLAICVLIPALLLYPFEVWIAGAESWHRFIVVALLGVVCMIVGPRI